MADIHIPDIPDDVIQKVMVRAKDNGRSFEGEILVSLGLDHPGVTVELTDYPFSDKPAEA